MRDQRNTDLEGPPAAGGGEELSSVLDLTGVCGWAVQIEQPPGLGVVGVGRGGVRLTLAVGVGSSLIRPRVGHQPLQHPGNPSPSVISGTDPGEAPHAQSCLFPGKLVWRVCRLQAPSILLQEVLAFGTSQAHRGSHSLDVKAITDEVQHMFYYWSPRPKSFSKLLSEVHPKRSPGLCGGILGC